MANVQSAGKRNRQRIRRRQRNLRHLTKLRTYVKRVQTALRDRNDPNDPNHKTGKAEQALKEAICVIDRAAQKGVIKRKTASRKISRLTKRIKSAAGAR
jgi:small subunit ribosomal protein S20